VAADVRRILGVIEIEHDMPTSIKVDVVRKLKKAEKEANSDVPRWEVIRGAIAAVAKISPRVIEIAKSLGISYFG
jgi:hypothetical protein